MASRRQGAAAIAGCVLAVGVGARLLSAAGPSATLPPEKQALVDIANAFQQSGQPGDKSNDSGRPLVLQEDPSPPTGMLGAVAAPVAGSVFTTENAWADWINGTTYVQIYAGAPAEARGQGLLFVVRRTGYDGRLDASAEPGVSLVPAPLPGGPLRIIRVDWGELIIANPDGVQFRFNPVSGLFD